ncbi:MAG: metallophosphoesterase [Spirochaetota bacterium]
MVDKNNNDNPFNKINDFIESINATITRETRRWEILRHNIRINKLPEKLKGFHIVQLSDLHAGPYLKLDRLNFFVEKVNELNPDIIAVTGDMLHESVKALPIVIEGLKKLKAKYGVYSVLGNHDHYDDYTQVVKAFKQANLRLLMEETETINVNGELINIIGVDYPVVGRPVEFNYYDQLVRAKKGSNPDALDILLAHNPDAFPSAVRLGIDLTLSGHTHGGQLILGEVKLFGEKVLLAPIRVVHKYVKGHYQKGDKHLYVSKGIGHWFPIRINCPSEITSIKLV